MLPLLARMPPPLESAELASTCELLRLVSCRFNPLTG
jgi:hypothetical protein